MTEKMMTGTVPNFVNVERPASFFSVIVKWNAWRDIQPANSDGSPNIGYHTFSITCDRCGWEFVDGHPDRKVTWNHNTLLTHRMECPA